MVELAPYNNIPHLVSPVITDAKAATAALKWVVEEMERRYELFAHSGVREIERFNEKVREQNMGEKLPYLVVVIDELADLMMVAPNEVEESICRIAQKARACGIHLLIATQRPSVDVITGLIKANIPTRIAFSVSSAVDSRTIIDMAGAEKLLEKGICCSWRMVQANRSACKATLCPTGRLIVSFHMSDGSRSRTIYLNRNNWSDKIRPDLTTMNCFLKRANLPWNKTAPALQACSGASASAITELPD